MLEIESSGLLISCARLASRRPVLASLSERRRASSSSVFNRLICSFALRAFADIADGGRNGPALGRVHGTETDFNGEFRAVFSASKQLQTNAHRARARLRKIVITMGAMILPVSLWDQQLNLLAEQLSARVAKQLFRFLVDQFDFALGIHNDDGVGGGFKQAAKMGFTSTDHLLIMVSLNGNRNYTRDRLEKVDVILREVPLRGTIGAQNAEGTVCFPE